MNTKSQTKPAKAPPPNFGVPFEDRVPLSTMEQAIWKLVQIRVKHPNEPLIYSAALSLIADMFWVGEYLLNEKVNRAYREIDLIDEKAKPKARFVLDRGRK